jgi:hypothetical protein
VRSVLKRHTFLGGIIVKLAERIQMNRILMRSAVRIMAATFAPAAIGSPTGHKASLAGY